MNTQHDITVSGQTIPLDPPRPPKKPHKLLWIDLETTGISRTTAKILEIGMIVTSLDGTEDGDRFICPVRPAGSNVDYDIDMLDNQLAPYLRHDWLRQLTNHRKLDISTYRIGDLALGHNPYQGHAGTHRVKDCIKRDRNDYATYLDIMRAGTQGDRQ